VLRLLHAVMHGSILRCAATSGHLIGCMVVHMVIHIYTPAELLRSSVLRCRFDDVELANAILTAPPPALDVSWSDFSRVYNYPSNPSIHLSQAASLAHKNNKTQHVKTQELR